MRSRNCSQTFRRSPTLCNASLAACRQAFLMGSMACNATFICTISRGDTRPVATFEMIRSKSPIWCNCSSIHSRKSGSRKKYSTISRRWLMGFSSFKGNTSQRRNRRLPIGDTVRSMTSNSDLPSSCMVLTSSSERTVNLSRRTYLSSSMRASVVICAICECSVCSRYCRMAPAAMTPFFRWSTPKPFSDFTLKWR